MMFQPFDTQNFEPGIGNVSCPRNLTTRQEAAARGLGWPIYSNDVGAALLAQGGPPIVGILIDPQLQAPSAMVNTLGFQRTLGSSRVLEASYVGTRGYEFSLYRTYNQPDRITGLRPNPSLNQAQLLRQLAKTNYHSMQASFRQRPGRHFSFNVNYTLSKATGAGGRRRHAGLHRRLDRQRAGLLRRRLGVGPGVRRHHAPWRGQRHLRDSGKQLLQAGRRGTCSAAGRSPASSASRPASRCR